MNEYAKNKSLSSFTLSPVYTYSPYTTLVFTISASRGYNSIGGNFVSFRPSINLKSGIKITSGNGTKEKPYEIAN